MYDAYLMSLLYILMRVIYEKLIKNLSIYLKCSNLAIQFK